MISFVLKLLLTTFSDISIFCGVSTFTFIFGSSFCSTVAGVTYSVVTVVCVTGVGLTSSFTGSGSPPSLSEYPAAILICSSNDKVI